MNGTERVHHLLTWRFRALLEDGTTVDVIAANWRRAVEHPLLRDKCPIAMTRIPR